MPKKTVGHLYSFLALIFSSLVGAFLPIFMIESTASSIEITKSIPNLSAKYLWCNLPLYLLVISKVFYLRKLSHTFDYLFESINSSYNNLYPLSMVLTTSCLAWCIISNLANSSSVQGIARERQPPVPMILDAYLSFHSSH